MDNGFFTLKETQSKIRPDGKRYSCVSCGLYKNAKSPKLKPSGQFKKKILNIGEAPGEIEDTRGDQWQGRTGKYLQRIYKSLGIDLFEDCLNINACHCIPLDKKGNSRAPTNYEIESCRKVTLDYIDTYQPKLIILLGNSAIYSIIGNRWNKDLGGMTKWRGWTIPDLDLNAWVCPVFHPNYIERSKEDGVEETIWLQDLKQAFQLLKQPLYLYKKPKIEIIEDLSILRKIKDKSTIAFDYETTGLKPHKEGHRIVCVSVATGENHAYVFMMPKSRRARQPFVDLLINPKIYKIAANMKFEETWSKVRLETSVKSWLLDTMVMGHILDNRKYITGLKFQTYVQFGIIDYDSEVSPYLRPKGKKSSGNDFNQVDILLKKPRGKQMLLEYCALDSIYEYRLAMKQMEITDFKK